MGIPISPKQPLKNLTSAAASRADTVEKLLRQRRKIPQRNERQHAKKSLGFSRRAEGWAIGNKSNPEPGFLEQPSSAASEGTTVQPVISSKSAICRSERSRVNHSIVD